MCAPKNHAMENHVRQGLAVCFFFNSEFFLQNLFEQILIIKHDIIAVVYDFVNLNLCQF